MHIVVASIFGLTLPRGAVVRLGPCETKEWSGEWGCTAADGAVRLKKKP